MKLGLRLQALGAFGPLLICAFIAMGWFKLAGLAFVVSAGLFGAGLVLATGNESNLSFFLLCGVSSACGRLLQISSTRGFSSETRLGIRILTLGVMAFAVRYYVRTLERLGADGKQLALALGLFVLGLLTHASSWQSLSWLAFSGGAFMAALGYARYAQILITLASGDFLSSQQRVERWESE